MSPDGHCIIEGDTLTDLTTAEQRSMPVRDSFVPAAFTADGCILGTEFWRPSHDRPQLLPEPIFALPLVRHAWFQSIYGRFVVLDAKTGRHIRHSQWVNSVWLENVVVSSDAKTAVASSISNYITVWEIPD